MARPSLGNDLSDGTGLVRTPRALGACSCCSPTAAAQSKNIECQIHVFSDIRRGRRKRRKRQKRRKKKRGRRNRRRKTRRKKR